jgi:hypothetical protein
MRLAVWVVCVVFVVRAGALAGDIDVLINCTPDPGGGTCTLSLTPDPVIIAANDRVQWTVDSSCALVPCPGLLAPAASVCSPAPAGSVCLAVPGLPFGGETLLPGETSSLTAPIPNTEELAYTYFVDGLGTKLWGTIAFTAPPSMPYIDTFDDGVIHQRYKCFGGATMVETDGQLVVTLPSAGAGLFIDTSDLPGQACNVINFDINPNTFDIGTELTFQFVSDSVTRLGSEFVGMEIELERPFWNFCRYTVCQGSNAVGTVGFSGDYKKEGCPEAQCLRFDWLEPEVPDPSEFPDCTEATEVFQIELKSGPLKVTKSKRFAGKSYKFCRDENTQEVNEANFTHENNQIKGARAVKEGASCDEDGDGGGRGVESATVIAFDDITVDVRHQESGTPTVSVQPRSFERGQVVPIQIVLDRPFLDPALTEVWMGPEVRMTDLKILNPQLATATIEIDARARGGGHWVSLDNDEGGQLIGEFYIKPIDPAVIDPENEPPTVEIMAPSRVEEGEPFSVQIITTDPDDEWVESIMAVMDIITTATIITTEFTYIDTEGGVPQIDSFEVPGLPVGTYKILAIPNDGLAVPTPAESFFVVASSFLFLRGDVDGKDGVPGSTTDLIYLASYLFLGGPEPPCLAAADVNGEDGVPGSTADIIYLANYLFLGGQEPPAPGPRQCGPGTEDDAILGCDSHPCMDG